jgi:hypothetical protein
VSGLASMYPAFDWSAGSGPSWISARVHAWSGRSVIHLSLVVHAGGGPSIARLNLLPLMA